MMKISRKSRFRMVGRSKKSKTCPNTAWYPGQNITKKRILGGWGAGQILTQPHDKGQSATKTTNLDWGIASKGWKLREMRRNLRLTKTWHILLRNASKQKSPKFWDQRNGEMRRRVHTSFSDVYWEKCVFEVLRKFKPEIVAHNLRTFLSVLGPFLLPLNQKWTYAELNFNPAFQKQCAAKLSFHLFFVFARLLLVWSTKTTLSFCFLLCREISG